MAYTQSNRQNARLVTRVAICTLAANLALGAAKGVLGLWFKSTVVVADAVHALSDAGASLVVILAVQLAKPKSDKVFNYGREKIEPLMVLFFALFLCGVGATLSYRGILGLLNPSTPTLNPFLLGITTASIIVKETMYYATIRFAKRTKSNALKADAWHHRTDSLSSTAVLVGQILGAYLATSIYESVATLIVSVLIIKVSVQILVGAVRQLLDVSAGDEVTAGLLRLAGAVDGVRKVDRLKTRLFGGGINVDIEISVSAQLTAAEAHAVAHGVQDVLENSEHGVKLAFVHVNIE